jgi:prevent-host-death family protein
MAAAQFKAKCLSILDEVRDRRVSVTVTKNGKPVAKMVPLDADDDPLEAFRFPGTIDIAGDIMAPLYPDKVLEEFFEHSAEQLK